MINVVPCCSSEDRFHRIGCGIPNDVICVISRLYDYILSQGILNMIKIECIFGQIATSEATTYSRNSVYSILEERSDHDNVASIMTKL